MWPAPLALAEGILGACALGHIRMVRGGIPAGDLNGSSDIRASNSVPSARGMAPGEEARFLFERGAVTWRAPLRRASVGWNAGENTPGVWSSITFP